MGSRYAWTVEHWPRLGLAIALGMLASLPALIDDGNRSLVLLTTLLPAYMIHQYEEHAHGRFVADFNATIGRGRAVLTKESAFWINVGGVWAVFLASFYLARYVALGFAFVPIYLTILNGLIHVATGLRERRPNPGLVTSLALFLPLGCFLLVYFADRTRSTVLFNAVGLAVAVVEHAAIVAYAVGRRRALAARSGAKTNAGR